MAKFKFEINGIDEIQSKLGKYAAKSLEKSIHVDIAEGINEMAEMSYDLAPVDTGALRSSILASVSREGSMEYIYGSTLPYAQWQEYKHETNGAYFRRAVWAETPELKQKIGFTVRRRLG